MARYIDADKLTDKLEDLQFNAPVMVPVMKIYNVIELVEDQPTAEVEEVRHGEWMKEGCCFYCSECKKTYGLGSTQTIYDVKRHWLHCPNCGAKMDGGKDVKV